MLKKILIKALNKFLGSYIENIDKHQLELGIFRGCISISNLKMKPSVISRIFEGRVIFNHIGSLQVLIPWRSFNRKPIEIYVKDVKIKLGRAGFCWCFTEEKPCAECIDYQKYEFMNKIDKLNLLIEALKEKRDFAFFEDFVRGGSFRLLVENIAVEYVSGTSMVFKIKEISFNREIGERADGTKLFDIIGAELTGSSNVLGPLDIHAKIKIPSKREEFLYKINFCLDEVYARIRQPIIEEILVGFSEYNLDRIRWALLKNYEDYRMLLRLVKSKNIWEDSNDDAERSEGVVKEVWRRIVSLQKKAIESDGVILDEVPGIMKRMNKYKGILRKSSLGPHEIEEKKEFEKQASLKVLLNLRKSIFSSLRRRSWRDLLFFGSGGQSKGSPREKRTLLISSKISIKELGLNFIDKEHHGFRIKITGGKFRIRNVILPSRFTFDFKGCNIYFINTEIDEDEPCEELISSTSDIKGTFIQNSLSTEVKGCIDRGKLIGDQKNLLHCLEGLFTILVTAYFPSFKPKPTGNKTKLEFKVNTFIMSDLQLAGSGSSCGVSILAKEASSSYFSDPVNRRIVASLVVPSLTIYNNDSVSEVSTPLSNSVEISTLLVNDIFYIKTSKVDLYAHGFLLDKLEGDKALFPSGFTIPRFEICSDAIKLNRPEGTIELKEFRALGNGGTVLKLEIYKAKIRNNDNKIICSMPNLKAEVKLGQIISLNINHCRVLVGMRKIVHIINTTPWPAMKGRGPSCFSIGIGKIEVSVKNGKSTLNIDVNGYSEETIKNLKVRLFSNILEIDNASFVEGYKCEALRIYMGDGDVKPIKSFIDRICKIKSEGTPAALKVLVSTLIFRSYRGLILESNSLELTLENESVLMKPFKIRVSNEEPFYNNSITRPESNLLIPQDHGENNQLVVIISSFSKTNAKIVLKGEGRGQVDENIMSSLKGMLEDVGEGLSGSPSGMIEYSICLTLSFELCVLDKSFKLNTLLRIDRKVEEHSKVKLLLMKPTFTSNDGEHISLSDVILSMSSSEGIFFSTKRIYINFSFYRFICLILPALEKMRINEEDKSTSTGSSGICLASTRLLIEIDEVFLKNHAHDEIRLRRVKYDDRLSLYCSIGLEGKESKIIYEAVNTRKGVRSLLSILNGHHNIDSLVKAINFYFSEYFGVCKKLGLEVSNEAFDVILVDIEGVIGNGRCFFKINIPIGHFNVKDSSTFYSRILCSIGVYNLKIMEFEPVVEEAVISVKKGGILLNIKVLNQLRILCTQNLINGIRRYIISDGSYSSSMDPLALLYHQKVTLKNLTCIDFCLKTASSSEIIGAGECRNFVVGYMEYIVVLEIDGMSFPVRIVENSRLCLKVKAKEFVILISVKDECRYMTVLHPLTFVNLCNLDLGVRIHRSNVVTMDLNISYGIPCTMPLKHTFFLEIGLNDEYSAVGRIDIDKLGSSRNADGKSSWICKVTSAGGIAIGVDMIALYTKPIYAVVLIFYPTLEVVNKLNSTLNLMFYLGSEVAECVGESKVITQNTPFSIEAGRREDVYDTGDPEDSSLGLYNLNNKAKAKIFQRNSSLPISSNLSGVIKRETCEIEAFFGKHALLYKTRILLCPPMTVENDLGEDLCIDSMKFPAGLTCINRMDSIRSFSIGNYSINESVVLKGRATKIITLINKNCSASDIINMNKTHEGIVWSREAIFGGISPRAEGHSNYIRFLLDFRDDLDTKIVKFKYAFIIRNLTKKRLMIMIKQIPFYVNSHSTAPFHLFTNGFYLFMADHIDLNNLRSSGAFIPSDITATNYFSLSGTKASLFSIRKCICEEQQVFSVEEGENWPYIIYNNTTIDLEFNQEHDTINHTVKKKSAFRYALDNLLFGPTISLRLENKSVLLFLNRDGTVRVFGFVISITQMEKARVIQISGKEAAPVEELRQCFSIFIDRCLMSLVDKNNIELLCGCLEGIEATIERKLEKMSIPDLNEENSGSSSKIRPISIEGRSHTRAFNLIYNLENTNSVNLFDPNSMVEVKNEYRDAPAPTFIFQRYVEWIVALAVESIQLDNQSIFCVFPIALYPLDRHQRINFGRRPVDKFIILDFALGTPIHHISISNLYCRIQDFILNIEEGLARKIYKIFMPDSCEEENTADNGSDICYKRNLKIQNLKLEKMRTKINFLKDLESDFASNVVGFLINNISDFSLEVDGLKETDLYTTTEDCVSLFISFYLSQFRKNFYKVFTHLDFIGNIGSFAESVSTGVKDLFVEPASVDTTRSVALGFIKGGKSLLKNTVYGVSNTIGKVSKSISTSASLVTLDKEFKPAVVHHPYAKDGYLLVPENKQSNSAIRALTKSTGNLFDSIASGIAGIAVSPIEGASRGVSGFIKGVGKGVIGALTKPIVGVADLVTNFSDTIKSSVDGKSTLRIQYPRPPGYRLLEYNDGLSQSFYIFKVLIKKLPDEVFLDGTLGDFNGKCQLILTNKRLLVSNITDVLEVLIENVEIENGDLSKFKVGSCYISVDRPAFINSLSLLSEIHSDTNTSY